MGPGAVCGGERAFDEGGGEARAGDERGEVGVGFGGEIAEEGVEPVIRIGEGETVVWVRAGEPVGCGRGVGAGLDPEEGLGAEDDAGAGGPDDEPFAGDI